MFATSILDFIKRLAARLKIFCLNFARFLFPWDSKWPPCDKGLKVIIPSVISAPSGQSNPGSVVNCFKRKETLAICIHSTAINSAYHYFHCYMTYRSPNSKALFATEFKDMSFVTDLFTVNVKLFLYSSIPHEVPLLEWWKSIAKSVLISKAALQRKQSWGLIQMDDFERDRRRKFNDSSPSPPVRMSHIDISRENTNIFAVYLMGMELDHRQRLRSC